MAIFIDPPMWPAHATVWSHLISDSSYDELHEFARRLALPRRSFDLDHYDVPASLFERAVAEGAVPVGSRDVVYLLQTSALRVKHAHRERTRPIRRREYLRAQWALLGDVSGLAPTADRNSTWLRLGEELLARWNEQHRSYHDEIHLEDVLLALDHLDVRGETIAHETLLAAWFHDAIYLGTDEDEAQSASLAVASLDEIGAEPDLARRVGELILATKPAHAPAEASPPLAHLLDSDLAIFASPTSRYQRYADAVRSEYAHIEETMFRAGRSSILKTYLQAPTIYRTQTAIDLWEQRARTNLLTEIEQLQSPGGGDTPHATGA